MVLKRRKSKGQCSEASPWPDCPTKDKVRYRSEPAAKAALRTIQHPLSRAQQWAKRPTRIYQCNPGCYGWHLTSMEKED